MSQFKVRSWFVWAFAVIIGALSGSAAEKISLAWDPSPEPNIVAYRVYGGALPGQYDFNSDVPFSQTNITLTNLVGGQSYFFAVAAINGNGELSDFSNEVNYSFFVNLPPTALNAIITTTEDAAAAILLAGLDPEGKPLTFTIETLPQSGTLSGTVPDLIYTPLPNFFGADEFSFTTWDGNSRSASAKVSVSVLGSNDAPTLDAISNLTLQQNAGVRTVSLSGITSGAANEIQNLTVTATSSNPALIPSPVVSYATPSTSGSISFTPVANQWGVATITVNVSDGIAIVSRSFTVTINNLPTLNAPALLTLNEDSSPATVLLSGIGSGAANEAQPLTVIVTSSNPALIPTPTLSYASPNSTATLVISPAPNGAGTSVISVTVNDSQAANNLVIKTFSVTVNSVNDSPTLSGFGNRVLSENSAAQTVPLAGISSGATNESQLLTVTATSSNPSLIPAPSVIYTSPSATGSLIYSPISNQWGTATITVTVNDGGASNNLVARSFAVTVNNPPALDAILAQNINEDSGPVTVPLTGINTGATNEVQPITITAQSSNPALIPNPSVIYTSPSSSGSLIFSPIANASGSATITVSVNDGQSANNLTTRSFVVTVNPVNDTPTLNSLANVSISPAGSVTITMGGISSGSPNEVQPLSVIATSSNPLIIPNPTVSYLTPNSTGSLTLSAAPNQVGNATVTVQVKDGQASNNVVSRSFVVTIVSSVPVISGLKEISNDARTLELAWTTDVAATCRIEYGLTPALGLTTGTTYGTAHQLSLTNLSTNTTYYIRVSATGASGVSSQSELTYAATEPVVAKLWAAESSTLSLPMALTSSMSAQNGVCISTPLTGTGLAAFNFDIPTGCNYRLWSRVQTPPGGGSFYVSIDGSPETQIFISDNGATNQWRWSLLSPNSSGATNCLILPIATGSRRLTIRGGTMNLRIDELALVNDPLWKPILPDTKPAFSAARNAAGVIEFRWDVSAGNAEMVMIEYAPDGINFSGIFMVPAADGLLQSYFQTGTASYFRLYAANSVDRTAYSNAVIVAP